MCLVNPMLSLDSIATTKRIVEYIESDICPGLSLSGQLPLSGWLFQKHAPYFIQRRMSQLKYICFPLGLSCSCSYGSRLIAKFSASLTVKRPFRVVSLKQSYYYASIIALAPVMLIGMQSVSGINVYDVLLVIFFVAIGVVYISRRMP